MLDVFQHLTGDNIIVPACEVILRFCQYLNVNFF